MVSTLGGHSASPLERTAFDIDKNAVADMLSYKYEFFRSYESEIGEVYGGEANGMCRLQERISFRSFNELLCGATWNQAQYKENGEFLHHGLVVLRSW